MDINEILSKCDIVVPDDKVTEFNKLVRTNYKSIAEVNKLRGERDELKESLEKANIDLENFSKGSKNLEDVKSKHSKEVEELKGKLTEYEAKFKDIEITKIIKDAFNGKKFISKRVEDSVISEIKGKNLELKDGKLEGLDSYIEDLEKEDGVFEADNSNKQQVNMHVGKQKSENSNTVNSPFLQNLYKGVDIK
jgi:hypothetical protein